MNFWEYTLGYLLALLLGGYLIALIGKSSRYRVWKELLTGFFNVLVVLFCVVIPSGIITELFFWFMEMMDSPFGNKILENKLHREITFYAIISIVALATWKKAFNFVKRERYKEPDEPNDNY